LAPSQTSQTQQRPNAHECSHVARSCVQAMLRRTPLGTALSQQRRLLPRAVHGIKFMGIGMDAIGAVAAHHPAHHPGRCLPNPLSALRAVRDSKNGQRSKTPSKSKAQSPKPKETL